MNEAFAALMTRARAWFEQAHQAGWLDQADLARLAAVEQGTPADLFTRQKARPLVVAFFGGTGVGKSSLLNRLADAPLARIGAERPTSREVTVYVHESVELADLPPELPVASVQIRRHTRAEHRDVLWIDAPDIDSTEVANRRCALGWLPHVDLVCYVVSPERYRDDVGWCVLHERGHKHGWMFVLNRWDEGDLKQIDDFTTMLRAAGFENPLLLATCCVPGAKVPGPDQFDQIQAMLDNLRKAHGVQELTRLGYRARLRELRQALQAAQQRLGDQGAWERINAACAEAWETAAQTISAGAEWSLRTIAGRFATDVGSIWEHVRSRVAPPRGHKPEPAEAGEKAADIVILDQLTGQLWDDWTQSKLQACLDATEIAASRAGLAGAPLCRQLDPLATSAGARVTRFLRDHVRAAFARPGGALARLLRRVTGFLMAFLPAMALLWVAWAIVVAFYKAVHGPGSFRGVDLAVHSVLVVVIAWAVPFTIDRLLRPSLERTALRALRSGLRVGLDDIGAALEQALAGGAADARSHQDEAQALQNDLAALLVKPIGANDPTLARLMMDTRSTAGS